MDQHLSPDPNFSSNGPSSAPMPEFRPIDPEPAAAPEPGGTTTPTGGGAAAAPARAPVEPFTPDEIVNGVGMLIVMGAQLRTEDEAAAFREAFTWVIKPIFPTARVVEQLKLGEALTHYGVGRGMGPGGLDRLPPFTRILIGTLALGAAGFMALRAVHDVRTHGPTQTNPTVDMGDRSGAGPQRSPSESPTAVG